MSVPGAQRSGPALEDARRSMTRHSRSSATSDPGAGTLDAATSEADGEVEPECAAPSWAAGRAHRAAHGLSKLGHEG